MSASFSLSFQASRVTHLWSSYETAASTARHSTPSASWSHVFNVDYIIIVIIAASFGRRRHISCRRREWVEAASTIASTGRVLAGRGRESMRRLLPWMNLAASDDGTAVGACQGRGHSRGFGGSRVPHIDPAAPQPTVWRVAVDVVNNVQNSDVWLWGTDACQDEGAQARARADHVQRDELSHHRPAERRQHWPIRWGESYV